MSQQQENKTPKKECFFYFRYQMKLQFIPYVEEEIEHFIDLCEDNVHEDGVWERIMVVLNKRIKDIDSFFNKNWSDYRAQQILRSRKLLTDFCKKYHQRFSKAKQQEQVNIKRSIIQKELTSKVKVVKSNSQEQFKMVEQERIHKEKSIDKNKISWQKLPKSKIISSILTPKNEKPRVLPSGSLRRSQVNEVKGITKVSNDKSRVSSTSSDNIKINPISTISPKAIPKKDVYNKKLTKQEYIAYLRNKQSQI